MQMLSVDVPVCPDAGRLQTLHACTVLHSTLVGVVTGLDNCSKAACRLRWQLTLNAVNLFGCHNVVGVVPALFELIGTYLRLQHAPLPGGELQELAQELVACVLRSRFDPSPQKTVKYKKTASEVLEHVLEPMTVLAYRCGTGGSRPSGLLSQ